MHLLTRICLQNWYLVDALDIEIEGATALVGPTGAGKSSIADAIQTVLTGANANRLNLNPSASGKSQRTVLEYCLGAKDTTFGGTPLRQSCETVLALVFRDEETAAPITIGVAMSARSGDTKEEVLSRFIAPDFAYSVGDARRRTAKGEELATWSEIHQHLRRMSPDFEEYRTSAEKFTQDMLRRMRGPNQQPPNARHFLRALSNALAFKPIFDPTLFVREYVLEPDMLDVDRVRTSIDTWKHLEHSIEQIEAKLARVVRLENRFGSLASARLRSSEATFAASHAELRRCLVEWSDASRSLAEHETELERVRTAITTRRQWISEFDEEIRTKRMLAESGEAGTRTRFIEAERKIEEREASVRAARYQKIRAAFSMIARFAAIEKHLSPKQKRAVEAASEALRLMPDGMDPADALHGKGEKLQELSDEVAAASGLDDVLNALADEMAAGLHETQIKAEGIERILSSTGEKAVLSASTSKFLSSLERNGIAALPLCDVVEIIDEDWQYAVESLLGRGREAVIVDPSKLRRAFDIMYADPFFHDCMLVRTTDTPRERRRLPKGSVLESVESDNDHAIAFMGIRIGGFLKADGYDELEKIDRGVMKDGRISSAMGLSVSRKVVNLIMGRAARRRSGETLRNELVPLIDRLTAGRAEIRLLREAARVIGPNIDVISSGESLFDMEHSSRAARNRLRTLAEEMNDKGNSRASALMEEISVLEFDRAEHMKELEGDYQPRLEALLRDTARAESKLNVALDNVRKAFLDRKSAWQELSSQTLAGMAALVPGGSDFEAHAVLKRARRTVRQALEERSDIKQYLSTFRNDCKSVAQAADRDAAREQAAAIREFAEYAANWDIDVPKLDPERMDEAYGWLVEERRELEENELRKYRESCLNAAREMRRMLREDLLARLAEKLGKVEDRLEALNTRLAMHRFTRQTYSFSWNVNARFAKMYELSMRVGGAQGDITSLDGELDEALGELEDLISGRDGASTLADYRQYFMFEIEMTDAAGSRTTMSTRAVKGSGGEAQAPFYVAMAASLASAYFPGHVQGRPTGIGLAMFDEAFNKLDVANTQALLSFYKSMGLQLLIAGPEDKRATFTEVLDTIVLVNKALDGNSVYIDSEHPGRKAREALASINPDHGGVEQFRAVGVSER